MKISWTKGLAKEQVVDVRTNYLEALVMRRRLFQMLEERVGTSQKLSYSKELYESPNWALLQADARGYERALHEIMDLIADK